MSKIILPNQEPVVSQETEIRLVGGQQFEVFTKPGISTAPSANLQAIQQLVAVHNLMLQALVRHVGEKVESDDPSEDRS